MKYEYKFSTSTKDIEIDEEWAAVLKDLDRLEYNVNRKESRRHIHYDAFEFAPDFMGVEDRTLSNLLDGSSSFEYAIERLLPRHREILYRRAYLNEKYSSIAKSYGVSASAICHYYVNISKRFKKYYDEGTWLYSARNLCIKEAERIKKIPFGLDPAQVMAIRAYRSEFKSQQEIAALVKVPLNRVKQCLKDNPVLETKCPGCGIAVKQAAYGRMQVFCSKNCYYKWFRIEGMNEKHRNKLSDADIALLEKYRHDHLSIYQIHKLTGLSEQMISAYFFSCPLEFTICRQCGAKIPVSQGKRPLKYCSSKCCNKWHDQIKKNK